MELNYKMSLKLELKNGITQIQNSYSDLCRNTFAWNYVFRLDTLFKHFEDKGDYFFNCLHEFQIKIQYRNLPSHSVLKIKNLKKIKDR